MGMSLTAGSDKPGRPAHQDGPEARSVLALDDPRFFEQQGRHCVLGPVHIDGRDKLGEAFRSAFTHLENSLDQDTLGRVDGQTCVGGWLFHAPGL